MNRFRGESKPLSPSSHLRQTIYLDENNKLYSPNPMNLGSQSRVRKSKQLKQNLALKISKISRDSKNFSQKGIWDDYDKTLDENTSLSDWNPSVRSK